MNTADYQSPNIFLLLHHQISVSDGNNIIRKWLEQHPLESRATLSELLESNKVIVKHNKLYDLPQLSFAEASELVRELKEGSLVIEDRKYRLTKYSQCFIGSELVDWLIAHKDVIETEAISIGQNLLAHNLISHVHNDHDFKNEFLFYQFPDSVETKPSMSQAEAIVLVRELQQTEVLEVKDRRYLLNSYKQCFIGSELVDCLIKSRNITAAEATAIGQSLLEHNLILHVHNERDFKNEFLFYQFQNS